MPVATSGQKQALRHDNTDQMQTETCPLCKGQSKPFFKDQFLICKTCKGIFRPPRDRPNPKQERRRYLEHNNDVNDPRYQKFVSPITEHIFNTFLPKDDGLDFGAGTGPVISKVLQDRGYQIEQYDPYFHDNPTLLKRKYEYIACCEVIEHFYNPDEEFRLLHRLLKPGGKLYCMTNMYEKSINFQHWNYRMDPTHVFIYQKETLEWVYENIGFGGIKFVSKRLVSYEK